MSISNIKIGKRLTLSFGAILFLFAAAIYISYHYLKIIEHDAKQVKDETLPYVLVANKMVINTVQAQQRITEVSVTHNRAGFKDAEANKKEFKKGLGAFEKLFKEENDTKALVELKKMDNAFNEFYKTGKRMAEAYIVNGTEAGGKIIEEFDEDSAKVSKLVKVFQKIEIDKSIMMTKEILSSIEDMTIILFSIGAFGLFFGILIAIMNSIPIVRQISNIVKMANGSAANISKGDLTSLNFNSNVSIDFREIPTGINKIIKSMQKLIMALMSPIQQISLSANEISNSSQTLSQGTSEQASSTEEITSSITELSSQARQASSNAEEVKKISGDALADAEEGINRMKEMVQAMNDISDSSENITKIMKSIDEIAFQTNLLALNAAVEAARAGRHGKGFAVVAEEVNNLSKRSALAAKESAEIMETSIKRIDEGKSISGVTQDSFRKILAGTKDVSKLVEEISVASEEQVKGIEQVEKSIQQIDQVTQQNASIAEENASSSEELSGQAEELRGIVTKFKLDSSGNGGYQVLGQDQKSNGRERLEYSGGDQRSKPKLDSKGTLVKPNAVISLDEKDVEQF